jgi:soluble lytic murein transglycosylase-like protein
MPQFKSFSSFPPDPSNDFGENLYSGSLKFTPPPITSAPPGGPVERRAHVDATSETMSQAIDRWLPPEKEESAKNRALVPVTDRLIPRTGALDVSATQSLISALQATMMPSKMLRQPVVIPGARKKEKNTETFASPAVRRRNSMSARWRHSIIFSSFFAFLLISLFTLSPLNNTGSGIPGVSNIVSFVQAQQANWSSFTSPFTSQPAQSQQQQAATSAVQAPNLDLPTSEYVAIARQDAINAGIPQQYFVNQIEVESGFDPNAVSPAGAVGIAQFEPSTAAALGFNPYDPIAALQGAANYMASLSNTYGGDYTKALAAYNAGGGTVDQAVAEGGADWMDYLPAETQAYIYKITGI